MSERIKMKPSKFIKNELKGKRTGAYRLMYRVKDIDQILSLADKKFIEIEEVEKISNILREPICMEYHDNGNLCEDNKPCDNCLEICKFKQKLTKEKK